MEKDTNFPEIIRKGKITRKEAINKVGRYAAFTAATMMLLMSPVDGLAQVISPQKAIKKPKRH